MALKSNGELEMEKQITFGSVCSGIEAASVAWEPLGWSANWFAEIEEFPSAVLAHHWPDIPNLGDMTEIEEKVLSGKVCAPAILVGGTPCQAYSVAGKRESLSDERGQLTLNYVRLLNAIDSARHVRGNEPAVCVWENTPGVLNTKDNAFGCFLGDLAGESEALEPSGEKWTNAGYVLGHKRKIAWRVLDAQYFGLAQRRKRVFVVASARDGFDPREILFEREGLQRNTEPSRETQQEVTGTTGEGSKNSSHWDGSELHPTLTQSSNTGGIGQSNQEVFAQRGSGLVLHGFAETGFSHYSKGCGTLRAWGGECGGGSETLIVGALSVHENQRAEVKLNDVMGTLQCGGGNPGQGYPCVLVEKEYANCLQTTMGDYSRADGFNMIVHGTQDPCVNKDLAFCLGRNHGQENVLLFENHKALAIHDKATRHKGGGASRNNDGAGNGLGIASENAPMYTLTTADKHCVFYNFAVRKLMPVEGERLQGFPDEHTHIPYGRPKGENQKCPDGHRYKAIGNSMPVSVMNWIGKRTDKQF
jgi:DNA (cytosine-5)-methyltransferase 1